MVRSYLVPAVLTGAFCAVFALAVDAVVSMVSTFAVAGLAAVSGFFGSIFARAVLGKGRD